MTIPMDLGHVLLYLGAGGIACELIARRIKGRIDRASEQIAERDSDWRDQVPASFRTPEGHERVGLEDREAA